MHKNHILQAVFLVIILSCYHTRMVRILKIHVGKNQADEGMLTAILATIPWNGKLVKQVHVLDEHTYVVFYTDNRLFKLLKHVYPDIAGVENVRSEELTEAGIAEAIENEEVLSYLKVSDEYPPLGDEEGGDGGDGKSDPKEDK